MFLWLNTLKAGAGLRVARGLMSRGAAGAPRVPKAHRVGRGWLGLTLHASHCCPPSAQVTCQVLCQHCGSQNLGGGAVCAVLTVAQP